MRLLTVFMFFIFFSLTILHAQTPLPFVRVSPQASVTQKIDNFIEIKIEYSRPSINGREVWDKLVPYGLAPNAFGNGHPMPWRAGANENTVITLSHDAKIQGQDIAAGSYSIHMIPNEKEWTLILNKNTAGWGSFFYEKELDALRVKVIPEDAAHVENLMYTFDNLTTNGITAYLHWEKKKVPFTIGFDVPAITFAEYKKLLTNLQGFNPAAWAGAANYALVNNYKLDEGQAMIDKALSMNNGRVFNNLMIKAAYLEKDGKTAEARKIKEEAFAGANENQLNTYGYQLMGSGKLDEAIEIFKANVERYPDSWNVYDSLGEALNNKGNKQGALENYEKALKMAPDGQKSRIENIIKNL